MNETKNAARILVQAHPGASKNEVMRLENGVWHIRVTAPPVEGKANRALIEFLSEILDVSKSRIKIEKGAASRRKMVEVEGIAGGTIAERMRRVMA